MKVFSTSKNISCFYLQPVHLKLVGDLISPVVRVGIKGLF